MMAAQLIAAHNAAMECYRRAMIGEQTFEGRRENLAQANKLSRTYATLLEALNRHRGKGQQKVTVEHVHVHSGGQAVVGVVATPGGGDRTKSEDQPRDQKSRIWSAAEAKAETMIPIGSDTVGDPDRFRSLADLREMLMALPATGEDNGHVALLMRRCDGGRREVLERIGLMPEAGIPGDAWVRAAQPKRDMQIAVMQKDVAELIANGQPLTLFGDCLILDLDLSAGNLPAGSRLRVGSATLEVTPEPHNGCRKFRARFGDDALRFVSVRELRHRNLRGIYMCVAEGGEVKTGDPVDVMFRPRLRAADVELVSAHAPADPSEHAKV